MATQLELREILPLLLQMIESNDQYVFLSKPTLEYSKVMRRSKLQNGKRNNTWFCDFVLTELCHSPKGGQR